MPLFAAFKGLLGYGSTTSSTGSIEEPQRTSTERKSSSPTQGSKRDLVTPNMEEIKRARPVEKAPIADGRDTSSMGERNSMEQRRKDVMRARSYSVSAQDVSSMKQPSGYAYESHTRPKEGFPADSRRREPTQDRRSIDSGRRKESMRPRGFSASTQDITSLKEEPTAHTPTTPNTSPTTPRSTTPTDTRARVPTVKRASMDDQRRALRTRTFSASVQDIATTNRSPVVDTASGRKGSQASPTDLRTKDIARGRSYSMRKDARPFDGGVVDDRSVERSVRRQRREGSNVRDKQIQDLIAHNTALKTLLDETQESLKAGEQKKIELYDTMNNLRDDMTRLMEKESAVRSEAARKDRDSQTRIAELVLLNRRQEDEIRILKDRLRLTEERQQQTTDLLQVRTADLRGAETFLNTTDLYSGSEIISMVETLNAEIFQASAYVAELLEDPSMAATEEERLRNMNKYVRPIEEAHCHIGDSLFAYFLEKGGKVRADPLPLQLALQTVFTRWCAIMSHRFYASDLNNEVQRLYERIQANEPQAVSGRWRALTHTHVKSLDNHTHSDWVLDMMLGLLCLCGWSYTTPRAQKAILSMQQMVRAIEKLWVQLKSATKEGITTADFVAVVIHPGVQYDSHTMDDNYADSSAGKHERSSSASTGRVLCTVGMGLHKVSMRKALDGSTPDAQVDILLKPKVALEKVLKDVGVAMSDVSMDAVLPSRMDRRV